VISDRPYQRSTGRLDRRYPKQWLGMFSGLTPRHPTASPATGSGRSSGLGFREPGPANPRLTGIAASYPIPAVIRPAFAAVRLNSTVGETTPLLVRKARDRNRQRCMDAGREHGPPGPQISRREPGCASKVLSSALREGQASPLPGQSHRSEAPPGRHMPPCRIRQEKTELHIPWLIAL